MINDKVSMIFCTCDAYADLWENFFVLLKKYWPEFDGEIILNTESKVFQYEGYAISQPLNCGKQLSWSERLSLSLRRAQNPYVLIMLEDFYLKAPVNHKRFIETLEYMKAHSDVASITYLREPGASRVQKELPGFCVRKQFCLYKLTAHITLYRKEYLLSLLKKGESAWEFEVNGTFRSWFRWGKTLCPPDNRSAIFPYDFGSLILRGKYYGPVKRYFEKRENLVFLTNRETVETFFVSTKASLSKKLHYLIKGMLSFLKENA